MLQLKNIFLFMDNACPSFQIKKKPYKMRYLATAKFLSLIKHNIKNIL